MLLSFKLNCEIHPLTWCHDLDLYADEVVSRLCIGRGSGGGAGGPPPLRPTLASLKYLYGTIFV